MDKNDLQEQLVLSWIKITALLKNSRITKNLSYNESIVMLFAYKKHLACGGGINFKEMVKETKMMKSLVNRTVNSLKEKGLVTVSPDKTDKRSCIICIVEDKIDVFLAVHEQSLKLTEKVISVIGEDDTRTFINIVDKLDRVEKLLADGNT